MVAEPQPRRLVEPYLNRTDYVSLLNAPAFVDAEKWRRVVRSLPAAIDCREVLISRVAATPWRVLAKESSDQRRYQGECDQYTEIFNNWNGDTFDNGLSRMWQDALDLPIGGNIETVRWPDGRLHSIWNIDGATLTATGNPKMPLFQRLPGIPDSPTIYLSDQQVRRVGMTPRPEFNRGGWFMAPPERIYLAIEMLYRGDRYYFNLLIDVPPAGLLSLGDMSEKSAKDWVASFRQLMTGLSAFKIPVLYEIKERDPKWIPFNRPPTEIMFDTIEERYLQFLCAGYGITPMDIGVGKDRTLAGTIRQDRASRQTGFAFVREQTVQLFQSLLPPYLKFQFEEKDEETLIQLGRARLANMQAFRHAVEAGYMKPEDVQNQLHADALVTVDFTGLPEPKEPIRVSAQPTSTDVLQSNKPVGQGGRGEITKAVPRQWSEFEDVIAQELEDIERAADDDELRRFIKSRAKGKDLAKELDKRSWWKTAASVATIALVLGKAFSEGWRQSANALQGALFNEGLRPDPNIASTFNFSSTGLMARMEEYAARMVRNVDDGTRFYLNRIITSAVKDGLTIPEIADRIKAGEGIDSLLSDAKFLDSMVQKVQGDLAEMTPTRIRSIAEYEVRHAMNWAWYETLTRSGLTQKKWTHVGSDEPCAICKSNEALGFVPMDYMYPTEFEESPHPLAHPWCHCGLTFDMNELMSKAATINIWTGA